MLGKTLFSLTLLSLLTSFVSFGQTEKDAFFIKQIHDHILTQGKCYDWLEEMCTDIGARHAGSENYAEAVNYTLRILQDLEMDTTYTEDCEVILWERVGEEIVQLTSDYKYLSGTTLGRSIGTGEEGITGEVVEVTSLDEVEEMGEEGAKGKIVFYNRPMDPTKTNVFAAYGGAVDQRVYGPTIAAKYGAKAAIVRSMTVNKDDIPHTGVTVYNEGNPKIPAFAISTNDADLLSERLKKNTEEIYLKNQVRIDSSVNSVNVIAEIRGTEYPDEIILVGGHLDSWDIGQGAHDDGAGCVHAMQVIHTLQALGYKPKRTIRCVLFSAEENGLYGALEYAKRSNEKEEFHLAAIESDAGGFTPRGFTCDADESVFAKYFKGLKKFEDVLSPYDLYIKKGGSGADINPLKSQKGLLIGLRPDSQRYFDYHHTAEDNIDAVNKRELEMGAAAMTSLLYLIDKYGLAGE